MVCPCCREKEAERCGTCGCLVDDRKHIYYIYGQRWRFCDAAFYSFFVAYLVHPAPPPEGKR